MALPPIPPLSFLVECFDYRSETGEFFWKRRPARHFQEPEHADSWNKRHAGNPAFVGRDKEGYRRCEVLCNGRRYRLRAGRVALLMGYGIEAETVDHINHKTDDDRLANIRPATGQENIWHRKSQGRRSRRLRGAFPSGHRWCAKITHNGETLRLGSYDTEIEAHRVYEAAAKRLRGEFHPAFEVSSVA
jgi:hypothetical protein